MIELYIFIEEITKMKEENNSTSIWSRVKDRYNKLTKPFRTLSPEERKGQGQNGFGNWMNNHPNIKKVLGWIIGNRTVENFSTKGKSEKIKGIAKLVLMIGAMVAAGLLIGPLLPGVLGVGAGIGAAVGVGVLIKKKMKGIGHSTADRTNELEKSLKEKAREKELQPIKEQLKAHKAARGKEYKKGILTGAGVGIGLAIGLTVLTGGALLPMLLFIVGMGVAGVAVGTFIKRQVKQYKLRKEEKAILNAPLNDTEKQKLENSIDRKVKDRAIEYGILAKPEVKVENKEVKQEQGGKKEKNEQEEVKQLIERRYSFSEKINNKDLLPTPEELEESLAKKAEAKESTRKTITSLVLFFSQFLTFLFIMFT